MADEHRTPEYMRRMGLANLASFFSDVAKRADIKPPKARECFQNCLRWLENTDLDPAAVDLDTILAEVEASPIADNYNLGIPDSGLEKTVDGKRQILTAILKRNGNAGAVIDLDRLARTACAPVPAL